MKEYTCPKCEEDFLVEDHETHARCKNCGQAVRVCRDADFENGSWRDLTTLEPVLCDCHMRSQHHEPMCPNDGPV